MSAFVCSKNHVSALAHYAATKQVWTGTGSAKPEDFKSIYTILAAENVRSVCHRYQDDRAENYLGFVSGRGVKPHVVVDPVTIIKLADCLDYQSCETDDWKETTAYRILQGIRSAAIRSLPGYDAAPWGIA
jgi:hypothetical protein